MRTLSAALTTVQDSGSAIPYIKLKFTSKDGSTTYDYSTRILSLEHHEEPFKDYAYIIIRNDDLAIPDLTGYWVQIGYGFYTGNNVAEPDGDTAGNEYSYSARLWVKNQREVSMQGVLQVILYLEGVWVMMAERYLIGSANPPYYDDDPYETSTIYEILEDIIETELTKVGYTFLLSALGDQDDDIINDYIPTLVINVPGMETFRVIVQRLVDMTHCYLRSRANLTFEVRYPTAIDSVDATFYSYQQPYFKEYTEVRNAIVPNKITVFANEEGGWNIQGQAEDSNQIARYVETEDFLLAGDITDSTDAINRASAILTKQKSDLLGGRLIIPHHCGLELYDRVEIRDTRGT